jgi:hypothetical protein
MALRGTLKDFGIADILQLIGQQTKTGVLVLRDRGREVNIVFDQGSVVHAESSTRNDRDLIGRILVRGEVITEPQLAEALQLQRRTLKRLGDIFVDMGILTWQQVREFHHYQTTEIIYRLFLWKSGTYEFEAGEVTYDKEIATPISAENLLMEGFRQVDEWPIIRKKIQSYDMIFASEKALPGPDDEVAEEEEEPPSEDLDLDLDRAFSDFESSTDTGSMTREFRNIGDTERKIHQLVDGKRDVRKIIDLSMIGEFEACKALLNLVNAGFIRPLPSRSRGRPVGSDSLEGRFPFVPVAIRASLYLVILAVFVTLVQVVGIDPAGLLVDQARDGFHPTSLQEQQAANQLRKLTSALEVYRLEQGDFPPTLRELTRERLVSERDLRFPWTEEYYYRRRAGDYVLLRPIH